MCIEHEIHESKNALIWQLSLRVYTVYTSGPLKNEGYPSDPFTSENKSDRKWRPVKRITGRWEEKKTGHLKNIWMISFKSDTELPQKTKTDQFCVASNTLFIITSNKSFL